MPLLLCDLDETLLDRSGTLRRWATSLVADHDLDPSDVDWIMAQDRGGDASRKEFLDALNHRYGIDPPISVQAYAESYAPLFRSEPSVRTALALARERGWTIAVVSNGYAVQGEKIAAAGLGTFVDAVCISDLEGTWKPDAGLLRVAARRTGQTLDGAWMIGDNPDADIGAATNAGVASAWIRHGRTWPRNDYQPTIEVDTFAEAVHHIVRA